MDGRVEPGQGVVVALLRAITTVGGFTMGSRVLGFARDILIAALVGAGGVADAFFIAFKIPNLFRRLFAEGAFNAAFVPQFAGLIEREGQAAARAFAEAALAVLLWTLLVLVILAELFMPALMYVFAPGFADEPERFQLAIDLARITFPYLLFISLVSLMGGVLNSLGRFAAAAATPMLLNLCMIGAVLWLAPLTPTPGHALAWGVALAGVVQFVWLLVRCARAGIVLRLPLPRLTSEVKTMLRRVVPGAIGAGIYQVNLYIDMVIASLLPLGSISFLYYADRVNQLPLGVIGVAAGTALLPLMSRQLRAGDAAGAMASQNRTIEFSLFLTLPAAAALMVIAEPVVRILFERGAFGPAASANTAAALAIYATGLPAYVLIKALTPGFFAREDTATPVKVAGVAVIVNLALNLVLMGPFLHLGIAMATSASAWINAGALAWLLRRRDALTLDARLRRRVPRTLAASVVMAALLWGATRLLGPWMAEATSAGVVGLALLVGGGVAIFSGLALATGAAETADLRRLVPRRKAA